MVKSKNVLIFGSNGFKLITKNIQSKFKSLVKQHDSITIMDGNGFNNSAMLTFTKLNYPNVIVSGFKSQPDNKIALANIQKAWQFKNIQGQIVKQFQLLNSDWVNQFDSIVTLWNPFQNDQLDGQTLIYIMQFIMVKKPVLLFYVNNNQLTRHSIKSYDELDAIIAENQMDITDVTYQQFKPLVQANTLKVTPYQSDTTKSIVNAFFPKGTPNVIQN